MRAPRRSAFLLALLLVVPAAAAEHFAVIEEVFVGPPADRLDPTLSADARGQYVMIRMTARNQHLTANAFMRVEDADGNLLGRFGTFTSNLGNAGAVGCTYTTNPPCPAGLMGTQAADDLFTFAFDQGVDGQTIGGPRVALPPSGGRVCYLSALGVIDCVAWGNFDCRRAGTCTLQNNGRSGDVSANGCDLNFGTPAAALVHGQVLDRNGFNCVSKENNTDFTLRFPRPVNNAGANNNADADADTLIDVLDCNDASGTELWAATAIESLALTEATPTSSTTDLAWTALGAAIHGTGVTYDLPRGLIGDLPDFSLAGCLDPNTPVASSSDVDVPAAGQGFYYDVRGGASAACAGPYGPGRSGLAGACP